MMLHALMSLLVRILSTSFGAAQAQYINVSPGVISKNIRYCPTLVHVDVPAKKIECSVSIWKPVAEDWCNFLYALQRLPHASAHC